MMACRVDANILLSLIEPGTVSASFCNALSQ